MASGRCVLQRAHRAFAKCQLQHRFRVFVGTRAHQAISIANGHIGRPHPIHKIENGTIALKRISRKVNDQFAATRQIVQHCQCIHITLVHRLKSIPLQIEEAQMLQTRYVEIDLFKIIVAQVQIHQLRQITKYVSIFEANDLVLFQMQYVQFGQIAVDENSVQILAEVRRCEISKRIGQMQCTQIDEIGKNARMQMVQFVAGWRYAYVVMVEYETFDLLHVVIGFAANLTNVIVPHVDDAQKRVFVDRPKNIPWQRL